MYYYVTLLTHNTTDKMVWVHSKTFSLVGLSGSNWQQRVKFVWV